MPFPVTLVEEEAIESSKSPLILYEEGYNMSNIGDIEEILEKKKRKQMDNSLLDVRDITHKYIVVGGIKQTQICDK